MKSFKEFLESSQHTQFDRRYNDDLQKTSVTNFKKDNSENENLWRRTKRNQIVSLISDFNKVLQAIEKNTPIDRRLNRFFDFRIHALKNIQHEVTETEDWKYLQQGNWQHGSDKKSIFDLLEQCISNLEEFKNNYKSENLIKSIDLLNKIKLILEPYGFAKGEQDLFTVNPITTKDEFFKNYRKGKSGQEGIDFQSKYTNLA